MLVQEKVTQENTPSVPPPACLHAAFPSALRRGTEGFASEKLEQRRWVPAFAAASSFSASRFPSLLPGSLSAAAGGAKETARQGRAHDARAFAVRPRMACQRTSVAPSRSRRLHRRPRSRGCPLLAYFLWASRESRSLARMASEASHGRDSVFVATSQEQRQTDSNNKAQQGKERSGAPSPYPLPQSGRGEKQL